MQIKYTKNAAEDIFYWKSKNKRVYNRIRALVESIKLSPFDGIGKPEALKHSLKGKWSRRITQEHRLVYEVFKKEIIILQCRFHY